MAKIEKSAFGDALRDIAMESTLKKDEKYSLRLLAKEMDKLVAKVKEKN